METEVNKEKTGIAGWVTLGILVMAALVIVYTSFIKE
jgi:hypothetical protein